MDELQFGPHTARLVRGAKKHLDDQAAIRERALEYYNGQMKDFPALKKRSQVVSTDLRDVYKKVAPSIMRAMLSGDQIVSYEPVGPGDEQNAEDATKYVNTITVIEAKIKQAIQDAIFDAAMLKTGILKWSAYQTKKVVIQDYTDQPDEALLGLFDDPANTIMDHEKTKETDPDVLALVPNARRHSFKLKRVEEETEIRVDAIPRGSFLISADAVEIEEAELVGEIMIEPRSKFVAWGYDRNLVNSIRMHEDTAEDDDSLKGDDASEQQQETRKAMETIMVYEVYCKIDADDDGIAELWRVVYGEGQTDDTDKENHVILAKEIVSEAPYSAVRIERDPHQFEGHSLFEDLESVQRVKTALLRASLDNIYAVVKPRPFVNYTYIQEPDDLADWDFGEPVELKNTDDVRKAVAWETVPMVADKAFSVMEYFDEIAKDRTGITDASGGVDPEAFQNTSATAAQMMSESGVAQADAIVRSIAEGVAPAFKGVLKLVIAHTDQPKAVRIGGEWMNFDPAVWDVNMDCKVNVGLGGGTKERDLAVLQVVLGLQREIMGTLGADNPLVKPDQLHNTLAKITEAAGFASSEPYFTKPDPQEIAQKQQEAANQPNPEMEKIQMQMQLEEIKAQAAQAKERAQMEADLMVQRAQIQARTQDNAEKLALQREKMELETQLQIAKMELDAAKADVSSIPNTVPGGLNG